ncbi:aspartate--tRNA ligase [Aciditerrimonas ferrireducens]|nr:aspartate--tRNA ligase [Aciditerrimonas ferrireducens]MCK4177206.1 aspartate--tRNA ligase [Aciditerrimonas ferrireducens]
MSSDGRPAREELGHERAGGEDQRAPGGPEAPVGLGEATALRTHLCGRLRAADEGQRVRVCGWVARRREHGEHLAFVDLRDRSGLLQCVVDGQVDARPEWVVQVEGTVRRRPPGTENPALATGEVELGDCVLTVLNRAEPPAFPVDDRAEVDETTRLRLRYVDLRRPRLQRNLRVRAAMVGAIRRAMDEQGFCEVETPMLWTPTPEGAREFAVPSRLQPGRFYVLPQSPQIAKQLLMVGGLDRYYQIAKCFRDEDLRADRQFEFTQLDVELSFCEPADVHAAVSRAVLDALAAADRVLGELTAGSYHPPTTSLTSMTWREAMDRYGTDKPDLRLPGELVDLAAALAGTEVRALQGPCVRGLVQRGGATLGRGRLDALVEQAKAAGAPGLAWFRVQEADGRVVLDSPLARFLDPDRHEALAKAAGAAPGDLLLVVAGEWRACVEPLGQLRVTLGRAALDDDSRRLCWVTEFPLFDGVDDEGRPAAAHHPFTMPHPEDLDRLETEPASVRSLAYDLVLNGWELGSGSIRVHREDIQRRIFALLGIGPEEAEARFGFLLAAFRTGAPPHGGFAVGIDRLVALAVGEETIREVVAFPKTQSGADPLTGAPKPLGPRQLRELGLPPTLGSSSPGSGG